MAYPAEAIRFSAGTYWLYPALRSVSRVPAIFPSSPWSLFTFGWFHYERDSHTAQTRGPMSGSDSGQTVADV